MIINGIYQSLYDLIVQYVYGGAVVAYSYEELCAVFFSTVGSFVVMAIPFIVVFFIIKVICQIGSDIMRF